MRILIRIGNAEIIDDEQPLMMTIYHNNGAATNNPETAFAVISGTPTVIGGRAFALVVFEDDNSAELVLVDETLMAQRPYYATINLP